VSATRRSVFVGCGPRAREHAAAYRHVREGRIVAACARTRQHVDRFCKDFDIERGYTDSAEMLERERPDLVHLVTTADVRVGLMEIVADHHVPVAIVEKPIARQAEDLETVRSVAASGSTRFVVNTQLPYHPTVLDLLGAAAQKRIGEVRRIDASAGSTIVDQGVHLLDLAHRFTGFAPPVRVLAQMAGIDSLAATEPSPDDSLMAIEFEGGTRANIVTGRLAPRIGTGPFYLHKQLAVFGTRGFLRWSMVRWELFTPDDGYRSGDLDYAEQDELAQASLTDAAFGVLEPDPSPHPTRVEFAITQFNVILGAYLSSLRHAIVDLPCDAPAGLLDSLRLALRHPR
jgi:predicted dehydrogenase